MANSSREWNGLTYACYLVIYDAFIVVQEANDAANILPLPTSLLEHYFN